MSKKSARKVTRATTSSVDFNPDYTHIKQDLKRIGGLAAFFTVAMIALSFILK